MKKRVISMALAVALSLGLAAPAVAAGPTFSDVPETYWGYADIEAVAEAGLMNGTGNGAFSPEMKVSVAQFLTLLGRLVFPDVKTEGSDWFGPYVSAAQSAGLLAGTQVDTGNVEAEISRYDMAVILRAAGKQLGVAEKAAQSGEVTDYGEIPTKYVESVLAVYGMGLIRGDQAGNFNGGNTMMRAEVATVIMRLAKAKPSGSSQGETTEPEQPSDASYYLKLIGTVADDGILVLGERTYLSCNTWPNAQGDADAPYGQDRSGFTCTSSNPSVVQVERNNDNWNWSLTAVAIGNSTVTLADPYGVSASIDVTVVVEREGVGMKSYTICVRPAYYSQHTIRGNAYTHSEIVPDVAYKVYHTRDGGKTSQLVYEGVAPIKGGSGTLVDVELPEDAFYSKDAGFYISAEGELDGQRLVTSDQRTDGRSSITLVNHEGSAWITGTPHKAYELKIELTPPGGEKSHFTFKGYVRRFGTEGTRIGGATIQLYHKDGALVGETVSREDGTFEMECEVDALDGGFNKSEALYRVVAWGQDDAGYWGADGQVLWSLADLEIAPALDRDGPGNGNYRLVLFPTTER